MMKWGLKKINHPPIVIAKPIPTSSGQTSETPASEQTFAPPPPSEPAIKFSESRKKAVLESVPRRVLPPLNLLRVRKRLHQTNLSKRLHLSKLSKRSHQYKQFQF